MEDKRYKIGLFLDTFYPMVDGVIQVVDNYARRLLKYADVTVFTVAPRDKKYVDNFPYKVVRCSKLEVAGLDYDLPLPTFDIKFMNELNKSKLDIVHIHSPFSIGKVGMQYAKKHKIPCIATNHSQFKQDFYKATKSKPLTNMLLASIMSVFNKCDENWAVNNNVADVFVDYGAKERPKVVNNATDMQLLTNTEPVEELRKKYNISQDEKVLLFIGRITELKNIFFIADVLKKLKEKTFKFKMFYIGTGQDYEKLEKHIEKNGIGDCTYLLGKIADRDLLTQFYNLANLFVFPSLYDCSSLVQIEAASQKTPTIFIEGSVTADRIVDSQNGYLSKNDVDVFADKIISIFADEKKYQQVCETCYNELYINWDTCVKNVFDSYIKLYKKKKSKLRAKSNAKNYKKTIKTVKTTKTASKKVKKKVAKKSVKQKTKKQKKDNT